MNIRDLAIKLKREREKFSSEECVSEAWNEDRYYCSEEASRLDFSALACNHTQAICDALLECIRALENIASFQEGKEVNSSFDEPGSAGQARETLKKLGLGEE